jgi:CubicO group peptidase (beta-lactamase class C family)
MSRKICFSLFTILVFFVVAFLPAYAQPQKAEAGIAAIMQQTKMAGLSVAVVKDNKIIYIHSFGFKDLATQAPLRDDCMFRIASISKSFTATSILQLVEARKLSLNDDVSDLVGFTVRHPQFPATVITLRMLLSHRSGLNDSQGYFSLDAINPAKNPNWAKCYSGYEPGTGYQYCNLNYNLAGVILERVSGERFDQYVKHHVLDPLGLYAGYCVDSLDQSRFATLYEYNADSGRAIASTGAYNPRSAEIAQYTMGYSTPLFSPTGGMKISATDLAKYMMMHMNLGRSNGKRILRKKSARLMQTPLSEKEGYGMAIMTRDSLIIGQEMKGHTGSAYGLFSTMFFQRKEKFGIVAITNGYQASGPNVLDKVVRCLYESLIK